MADALAAVVSGFGEPLALERVPLPELERGGVLVKVDAATLCGTDVHFWHGMIIPPDSVPYIPGHETCGTIVDVRGERTDLLGQPLAVGDRVGWVLYPGGYAEQAVVPAAKLIPLPVGIDDRSAAAVLLQGMTAHYLTESTYPIRAGDTVLVHAAAGGLGLLVCQMAKHRGARVIGTTSTRAKAARAREAGADHVILYTEADFEAETRRLTQGAGVEAVYDSVGRTTFEKSLGCLKRRGMMVLCGASSGPVPPVDLQILNAKGSLYLTRPSLGHYVATRSELLSRATDVLTGVAKGELKIAIGGTYPLREAARAHRDLESRATTGKLLLLPD